MSTYKPDDLDRLLDEALATYASEEPRPGIEGRVLHRVRTDGRRERSGWWRWAVAIPVLAALLVLAVTHRPRPRILFVVPNVESARASATTTGPSTRPAVKLHRRAHRSPAMPAAVRSPLPRLDVFAFPAALSREERALMSMTTDLAVQGDAAATDAEPTAIKPIEIPKIEIAPLSSGSDR